MTQTATHDTTLAYDVEGALDPRWTEGMYESLSTGAVQLTIDVRDEVETVVLTGPCPRCGGLIRFSQVLTAVNTDGSGQPGGQSAATKTDRNAVPSARTLIAYCTCGGAHSGSPAAGGCGAAFRIEVAAA